MKGKRLLAILLSAAMMLSVVPTAAAAAVFQAVQTYTAGQFSDVENGQWYEQSVQKAYELGLMSGDPNGTFRPTGQVTLAETVTVAARIHALATTGTESFEQGSPWYQVYVDYALQNGILTQEPSDYSKAATRLEFAQILAKALPAEELTAINQIADGTIPDVADDESVYLLYRAGVLTGSDNKGTFLPDSTIQRSEVAAIITRMALPELRQIVLLGETTGLLSPTVSEEDYKADEDDNRNSHLENNRNDRYEDNWSEEEQDKNQATVPETPEHIDENNALTKPFDEVYPDLFASGAVSYSGERILIKLEGEPSGSLAGELYDAGVTHLDEMYSLPSAVWYKAEVSGEVETVMAAVRAIDDVLVAEYDFAYEVESIIDSAGVSDAVAGNSQINHQWHHRTCGIQKTWGGDEYVSSNHGEGAVVAVIDTGVDYNHEDLKDNIWVNVDEIPNNGIDDDDNGYIDDYYGFNAVANNGDAKAFIGDPMDDHGHGTHVAGIVAGVNNNIGVVGIAYGAKIMAIKAGMSSGYFHQSDIAEAILYAHANGADVINMSFGGTAITIAVTDALEYAYTDCVLVASAGNDGAKNEGFLSVPNYPAALKYVLGVMSVNEYGVESLFTNWDVALYNTVEYEVYAPGEDIMSTIPDNRYAAWDGTSMAAPVVSAMAAMLRNAYPDRNTYPTKFIYGQIVNSGDSHAICLDEYFDREIHGAHNLPKIVNIYNAITTIPNPDVGVTDYRIFDSTDLSPKNNGDGIIDAGETVALGFTVRNRWGMAENTLVTVDAVSSGGVACPYVTITDYNGRQNTDKVSASVDYGSVGTYSDSDCGRIEDEDDVFIGWEKPFLLKIAKDCPNDYIIKLNVYVQCENGLDSRDDTIYEPEPNPVELNINVRRGEILPSVVTENMTLTAEDYYIIPNSMYIAEGATVTVEPGTQIQFWTDDPHDAYADVEITYLKVAGSFICNGTEEEPIQLFPSELRSYYRVEIMETGSGKVELYHTKVVNSYLSITRAENCEFTQNYRAQRLHYRELSGGTVSDKNREYTVIQIDHAEHCAFYRVGGNWDPSWSQGPTYYTELRGDYNGCIFVDSDLTYNGSYQNCVFLGNNNYLGETKGGVSDITIATRDKSTGKFVCTDPDTGTTYLYFSGAVSYTTQAYLRDYTYFAEWLGGHLLQIETEEEWDYLKEAFSSVSTSNYNFPAIGMVRDEENGKWYWADGTKVGTFLPVNKKSTAAVFATFDGKGKEIQLTGEANGAIIEIPASQVDEITLGQYEITLSTEGSGYQIFAETAPITVSGSLLIYESEDPEIANVSEDGYVTGVSEGETVIRVYSPDLYVYNTLNVTVTGYVALQAIDAGADLCLEVGDTHTLVPKLTPETTSQQYLTYENSDSSVATVSRSGRIKAKAEGVTTITVTNPESGVFDTITVEVIIPVEEITVEESICATDLDSEELAAEVMGITVSPADATYQDLIWESSNPEVVTVDEDGYLVKKMPGYATLRATVAGTQLFTEAVLFLTERESAVTVKDVIPFTLHNGTDPEYYIALLSDSTLWYWGKNDALPKEIDLGRSEDAPAIRQIALFRPKAGYSYISNTFWGLLVLDDSNTLNAYRSYRDNISSANIDNSLIGGTAVTGVQRISAAQIHTNEAYAYLKTDGSVWFNGQQVELPEKGVDVVVSDSDMLNSVYILAASGNVYTLDDDGIYQGLYKTDVQRIYEVNETVELQEETDDPDVLKKYETTSGYGYGFYHLDKNGNLWAQGGNQYGQLGNGTTEKNEDYVIMEKGTDVSDFFVIKYTVYIQTNDGRFYGVGRNDNGQLPNLSTGNQTIPGRIYFGMEVSDTAPEAEGTNLTDGDVLNDQSLIVDLNMSVLKGTSYGQILLKNEAGEAQGIRREMRLDELVITPYASLVEGEAYTLTIPASAVTSIFGISNAEIVVSFIAGEQDESSDEMPEDTTQGEPVINETQVNPDAEERLVWTAEYVTECWLDFAANGKNAKFLNNAILNRLVLDNKVEDEWLRLVGASSSALSTVSVTGNYWGTTSEFLINKQIADFEDYQQYVHVNEGDYLTKAPENVWPFVVDAGLIDMTGEEVDIIGNGTVTFFVDFNRDMDTDIPLDVRFGSYYPYADYRVEGEWFSERRWEGTTTLTTIIENGYQFWTIMDGQSAADHNGEHLKLYEDWGRFRFKIDTTAAQAMILQGDATDTGISLTWSQDDYDTLAGYNIYRADQDEDAYYQRLNSSIIPVGEEQFFDTTVLPGHIYYYKFTVVQTDLSESPASGKIMIMSKDTMAPGMYHTPVYHGYAGSNLVISAEVTDNLAEHPIVKLHYRSAESETWKTIEMTALNDKYSAVIGFNDVTMEGIVYYISAYDGVNTTYSGNADKPYQIIIQEPLNQSSLGDIDNDGYITLLDALMVLQGRNDLIQLTKDQFDRGDLNGDGELTSAEALKILMYANGQIGSLQS